MQSSTPTSVGQFIDGVRSLLDKPDTTDIYKLSARLRPYRIETQIVTVDGNTILKSVLILEDEQMLR
jgi:hypothetical protein